MYTHWSALKLKSHCQLVSPNQMKLPAGVLLFTRSDSFIDIADCMPQLYHFRTEIVSESSRISSNSQIVYLIFQQVSLFQHVNEKWAPGQDKRLGWMISRYRAEAKTGARKSEQGGNVQVSRYFNLQVISWVLTKSGHIMI